MKRFFKVFGLLLLVIIVGLMVWMYSNLRDRNPGYSADMKIISEKPSQLSAGFAALSVTPEVPDQWVDKNNNAEYEPDKGDTFTDGNGNGVFDPVWIAGFGNKRAANGIHDKLWARTMVIDDGKTRIAIVSLDAIGFMNDDVIDVRKRIPADAGISYVIISSTHTHEGPDLLGLWGDTPLRSGINKEHMEFVKNQIANSVAAAVKNMRPASLEISEDLSGADSLLIDTRKPEVFDSGLRMIKAVDKENGTVLGSLISWGDHPETLWSDNLQLTSDFPHFVREGVEKGVFNGDSLMKPGIGGVAVYISASVGGLMTTHPRLAVKDPFTDEKFKEPTFEKAAAQGKNLSLLVLNAMDHPVEVIDNAGISIIAKTIYLPIDNVMFKLGTMIGTLDRGTSGWMKMRSELAVVKIGPLSFTTVPGEVYPEIINGGVEVPEGQDFKIQPVEVPAIRQMMTGTYKFVFGLANDEIGYIVPKSQWDTKAPFTYGKDGAPYGEENSLGPEAAPAIHKQLQEMLGELN